MKKLLSGVLLGVCVASLFSSGKIANTYESYIDEHHNYSENGENLVLDFDKNLEYQGTKVGEQFILHTDYMNYVSVEEITEEGQTEVGTWLITIESQR